MKKILLWAAVLCGMTSFAATEVKATFASLENGATSGDYKVATRTSGFCITGPGESVSTGMTAIIKYSDLGTSDSYIAAFDRPGTGIDRFGIGVKDQKLNGVYAGSLWTNANQTKTATQSDGLIVLSYSSDIGVVAYDGNGAKIYEGGGLKESATYNTGTHINFGSKEDNSLASGIKISAVQLLSGTVTAESVMTVVAAFEEAIEPVADVISVNVQQDNICNQGTIQSGSTYKTLAGDILGSEWGVINAPGGSRDANTASGYVTIKGATVSIYSWAGSNWSFINDTDKGAQGETQAASEYAYLNVFGSNRDRTKNDGWIGATNVPYEKYDVYIYFAGGLAGGNASTANGKYPGVRVASGYSAEGFDNTMYYKVAEDGTLDLNISSATQDDSALMWGSRNASSTPLLGSNVIKICGCTGDFKMFYAAWDSGPAAIQIVEVMTTATKAELSYEGDVKVSDINNDLKATDNKTEVTLQPGATVYVDTTPAVPTKLICKGAITLSANAKPDLTNLDLSGVTGGVIRTWLTDDEKKGIGFNFASARGPVVASALVADTKWYSDNDSNNGSNIAMSDDGLTTITWTSANTYDDDASTHGNNSSASMVRGYLDDANGVSITVKNIPFAEYAVIIYASTDDPNNPKLTHKVVNGTNYTFDSTCSDVAKVGTDAWGQGRSSSAVAYGTNAIRVIEQTKGTLTITSPKDTSIKARGCISAIQIVPYSTFVAPTVTIASVEAKCSDDYAANTITGTIADYVPNSWEDELTARVVVDSKVYESEAIEDNKFTIEVSNLIPGKVYRTNLEVGYTDGETFKAIATKAIALYQGEQKFVWIASPFKIQDAMLVNDAQGLTIENPFADPDYIDLCDSEYTVSISASEAVEADLDVALDGTEQGGIRIAQTSSGLKLQVVDKGDWVDFADAAVNTTYTLTVKFHYKKSQEGETDATSVTYTLDSTTKTSTNTTGKLKVMEIFVSDGTNLANNLLGACQLDSAVIVDLELKPGEGDAIDYNTEAEANAAIKTLKIGICDAVKSVLTTAEAQENYRKYFLLVVVPSKKLENGFSVMPEFTTEATNEIEKELEKAMEKVVEAFNAFDGKAEITGKPGLYYGVKRGDSLEAMSVKEDLQMAGVDGKVTISITKPDNSKSHFYRIIVSPTPAKTK